MPPSGVDYASEFLNGYAPEYVLNGTAVKYYKSRIGNFCNNAVNRIND